MRKTMMRAGAALGLAAMLAGCAEKARNVQAQWTPDERYAGLDCAALGVETRRVSSEVLRVSGKQDDAAARDALAVGVTALFWPALLLLAVGDDAEELAALKGEHEALMRAQSAKGCSR